MRSWSLNPLIEFDNVSLNLDGRVIFDRLSVAIRGGGITLLIGPSGIGKTTFLRLLTGQLLPDQGTVRVGGQSVSGQTLQALYAMRKKIGMLFQSSALFSGLTVAENVAMPAREHLALDQTALTAQVLLELERVGLADVMDLYPRQLSGGMSKRVALARAMILNPMLMLYDEPLSAQDPVTCRALLKLIKMMNAETDRTAIVVSHQIQSILSISDDVVMLDQGGLIFSGTVAQARVSTLPQVMQFIQNSIDQSIGTAYVHTEGDGMDTTT
jgi:phospholipid/cholesterol/gamma-HCH transport system ATP-binding protein